MKICTIYSNCQGEPLKRVLSSQPGFRDDYDVEHFMITDMFVDQNFEDIFKRFIDRLKKTDLFIYQIIANDSVTVERYVKEGYLKEQNRRWFYTDNIIKELLPDNCKTLSFPNIYFEGYHLGNVSNYRNNWKEAIKFPYGNWVVHNLIMDYMKVTTYKINHVTIEKIIERLNDLSLYTSTEIENQYLTSINKLKEKESLCDIKVSNVIEQNFKKFYLFHTPNHPSKFLINDVSGKIMIKCGYEFQNTLETSIFDWFNHTQVPIFPCVISHYKMNFWGGNEPLYNIRIGCNSIINKRKVYSFTHDDYWSLYISHVYRDCIENHHSLLSEW